MIKEIKYLLFLIVIILFVFFTGKYYFSDTNKKKSFRSLSNINKKLELYSVSLPIFESNTKNVVKYYKDTLNKKKKKYHFWKLIDKDDK